MTATLRTKTALLASWFFVTVATLWIVKSVRVAALIVYLGARDTPYVRLASVAAVAIVVFVYSLSTNRLSRVELVRAASAAFGAVFVVFWIVARFGGADVANSRPFIWAMYMLVDVYSVVMVEMFWTYVNDVVDEAEAKRSYGAIGLGGILGGVAGGAFVDLLARTTGAMNLLLVAAGLVGVCAALGTITEHVLKPPPRKQRQASSSALEGVYEVGKSRYLLLLVGVVVAYEITATLCDYGVNVLFEHAHLSEVELTRLYGRLGWVASVTAVVVQVVVVPRALPFRRVALLVTPLAMLAGIVGVVVLPIVATAFVLATLDRGLNYSLQQSTREALYVPLSDVQKYKAKAFIDMFVDRAAKAVGSIALLVLIAITGESVRGALVMSFASMAIWIGSARRLGGYHAPFASARKPSAGDTRGHVISS
jgi:AAA family ATP:ADP antiporter